MKTELMHGWEVEVCVEVPLVAGTNDADIDRAKFRRFDCKTRKQAIALAKRMQAQDIYGSPVIQEFQRELREPEFPRAGYRKEYIGEREEI